MALKLGLITAIGAAVLMGPLASVAEESAKATIRGPNAALLESVSGADNITVRIFPARMSFRVPFPDEAFSPNQCDYVVRQSAVAPFLALLDEGILGHVPGVRPNFENRVAIFFRRDGATIDKLFMSNTSPITRGYFKGEALNISPSLAQKLRDFSSQPGVEIHDFNAKDC